MKKPGDIKTIHRFQPFSDRIQSITVDVSRKIEKKVEVPEDEETFFAEGLLKWRDLDHTAHFTKFYQTVEGCTQTFAQLVHNEKKVVDSLIEHLEVKDSMALEALLDLVVQLARDLQKDFYPHFKRFFSAISKILNCSLKSWEILDQAFSCLSYLFKVLWRKMVQDMKQVLVLYRPFLRANCREYIRRFSGESLSYLMRKVKDKTYLFNVVFSLLDKHADLVDGVGNLIFEMVKGAKNHFHSCVGDTLKHLLQSIADRESSSLHWHSVKAAFNLMAEHVDQANAFPLWHVIQEEIESLLTVDPVPYDRLESVAALLFSIVDFKGGCLLPRPSTMWCKETLIPLVELIGGAEATEEFVSIALENVSSLLLCEKTTQEVSTISRMLSLIYRADCIRNLACVFRFTAGLFQYRQFEKDVLRKLIDFCSECLRDYSVGTQTDTQTDTQGEVLAMLSKLIIERRAESRDGVYRQLQQYPLKCSSGELVKCLYRIISSKDVDSIESLQELWSAFIILPHSIFSVQEDCVALLQAAFSHLYSTLLRDGMTSSHLSMAANQCLHACLYMRYCPQDVSVLHLLQKYADCPHVLRLCSIYLTYHKSQNHEEMFSLQGFEDLYPLLKSNISSPKGQVRLLTLRILSLYDINARGQVSGDTEQQVASVFDVCLRSEEQQATLANYREKLRILRDLDHDVVSPHLPSDASLDDVPLYYLSAVLYVNFSMLWPEALTLIESHGKALTKTTLWNCYGSILETAASNCMDCHQQSADEEGECEEASALIEIYNQVQSYHDNNCDRVDFCNQRLMLWKAMHAFSHKCEQHSATAVQLFFKFLEKEYYIAAFYDAPTEDISRRKQEVESMETGDEAEGDNQGHGSEEESKKRTKVIYQTLVTKLTLFSKFQHPMRISQEPRLTKLYNDLLLHRDMAVQQVSLKCLMTYKKKQLLPYSENLERLLDDGTFRTELALFSIDPETSTIKEEDRPKVMPVLLRLLYGRMLHSAGKETKGRGGRADLRRTIVLSFLAGCKEEELEILLDLIMDPFTPLFSSDCVSALDLAKAVPPRRILGILSTVVVVMDKLGHLMTSHFDRILHLLMSVLRYCVSLLDKRREEINLRCVNSLKVARQTAIKCLSQFMEKNSEYEFTELQVTDMFDFAVWPQLPRLTYEAASAPTALLRLIETWAHYRRYIPLLLKLNPLTSESPLAAVMKLLAAPLCKPAAGSLIMELVDNILDFHSSDTREIIAMETNESQTMPVGEIVQVDSSAGSYEVGMLIPHLYTIINYIRGRVSRASLKATNHNAFPMKELHILSICSQYVDAPALCSALLLQLLPFLTGGVSRLTEDIQCGILRTVGNLAKKTEDVNQQLCKLLPLCSSLTQRLVRIELVKQFESLRDLSADCKEVADFVKEVNAFDRSRIEEPDYDSRLGAFREIVWWDYDKCALSLVVAIIHNSAFTLRHVDDMALRDSASAALQVMVKKMPEQYYDVAINSHLAPLVRAGIQLRNDTVRSEFLAILRDMVNSRPDLYADMAGLTNQANVDDDFWENIRHIQVSRRLKGLNRLMRHLDTEAMKSSTLTKYLLPLVFSFIKDDTDYHKKNAMVDVCIESIGAICKHLPWSAYKSQLKVSLHLLARLDNNKMAVRLLCTILNSFHYDVSKSSYVETQIGKELSVDVAERRREAKGSEGVIGKSEKPTEVPVGYKPVGLDASRDEASNDDVDEGIDVESETADNKSQDSPATTSAADVCSPALATNIHSHIIGSVLPMLHQILSKKASTEDLHKDNKTIHPDQAEVLRIPLAVAIVTLLQKISSATLERHLPSVLMKVCYFLKSRAEDIRDSARQTLAKMLACLGVNYMSVITEHLQSTLLKGYQVNVLGYSLHYIINQNVKLFKPGDLASCLHTLVSVNMNGLFGSSSHDKDVDKHDTSKEKRKPQYYELFWLLARLATAPTVAVILLPLKQRLDVIHKAKDMSKVRQSLERIAAGLLQNTELTAEQYLKFIYSLISDSVGQLLHEKKARQTAKQEKKRQEKAALMHNAEETFVIPAEPGRAQPLAPTLKRSNKHVLVEFGMKLFHMLLKKAKISFGDENHARMVDPYVKVLVQALSSEDVPVIVESLICLTFVIKFKGLPSLVNGMEEIITNLFLLLRTYSAGGTSSGESFELCQLCFRLISMVLKTCGYYEWTEGKIEVLLSYAESDILDHNRQATAFSLLKAIMSRKLLSKLLYELMKKIEELSVKSESSDVRLNCRQVVLQFLLDYPLGKGLSKHINFFLENLDYSAQHGRESVYEMLGAMLTAFPQKTVHTFSSTLFISLAQARVNDDVERCRRLAALGIKTLLGRVERNYRTKLFHMAFKWLQESKVEIVQMAAQVLGLFVEVECDGFSSRFNDFLPTLEKSLQPQIYLTAEGESDSTKDLQLYHLIMLTMKVVRECPRVLRQATCDIILEHIKQHMLHPHAWVRYATAQVFGLLFSTYNPDEFVAAFLSQSTDDKPLPVHSVSADGRRHNAGSSDANKSYRNMMFLLRDTRQKLRDFTADFCTQLSSQFMDEQFGAQIVKNLIFLVKVILKLPESKIRDSTASSPDNTSAGSPTITSNSPTPDDTSTSKPAHTADGESQVVSVDWLIRRLGKVATFEATNAPRDSVKRSHVFKCLAAIALELGQSRLQPHLRNILPPIHRELTMVNLFPETEDLRNLAGEVCNLFKSTVGVSVYSSEYASVHKSASERKAERKRKLAQQAVTNPSITAKKKMRLHTKKQTSKRRAQKTSRFQGNKFSSKSKRPVARDMAIVQ